MITMYSEFTLWTLDQRGQYQDCKTRIRSRGNRAGGMCIYHCNKYLRSKVGNMVHLGKKTLGIQAVIKANWVGDQALKLGRCD